MPSTGTNVNSGGLGKEEAASPEPEKGGDWGDKKGTEDDKEILSDLIKEALKDPANQGNSICFCKWSWMIQPIKDLDEDLAEAISKDFYNYFKNWTQEKDRSTNQKVHFQR